MNLAEELMKAFEGFRSAHGQTEVSTQRMAGKQKAKSDESETEKVTIGHLKFEIDNFCSNKFNIIFTLRIESENIQVGATKKIC